MKTKINWLILALATLMYSCKQETIYPVLEISDTSYTFDATGGTFETIIISSSNWNITSKSVFWLNVTPTEGNEGVTNIIIAAQAKDTPTNQREAYIRISNEDGITKNIFIQQK